MSQQTHSKILHQSFFGGTVNNFLFMRCLQLKLHMLGPSFSSSFCSSFFSSHFFSRCSFFFLFFSFLFFLPLLFVSLFFLSLFVGGLRDGWVKLWTGELVSRLEFDYQKAHLVECYTDKLEACTRIPSKELDLTNYGL